MTSPTKYHFLINERTIDLITFLNNGVRPKLENNRKPTAFLVWIQGPNEITTTIEYEDEIDETRTGIAEVFMVIKE